MHIMTGGNPDAGGNIGLIVGYHNMIEHHLVDWVGVKVTVEIELPGSGNHFQPLWHTVDCQCAIDR